MHRAGRGVQRCAVDRASGEKLSHDGDLGWSHVQNARLRAPDGRELAVKSTKHKTQVITHANIRDVVYSINCGCP